MFRIILSGFVLCVLIMLPISANSQTSFYLGPHIGIQKSQDAQEANYLVGATLRMKLSSVFGAEGDFGYRQEKYGTDVVTVKSRPVIISMLLYPMSVIYGGFGAGWYNTIFDYADRFNNDGYNDRTSKKFGWHLATGIEFPAMQNINLFGDVRYVYIDYNLKEVPDAVLDGVDSDFYSINFGLLYRL